MKRWDPLPSKPPCASERTHCLMDKILHPKEWFLLGKTQVPRLQELLFGGLPSLKLTVHPWKSVVGKWQFLLGRPISRGYVSFREGTFWKYTRPKMVSAYRNVSKVCQVFPFSWSSCKTVPTCGSLLELTLLQEHIKHIITYLMSNQFSPSSPSIWPHQSS